MKFTRLRLVGFKSFVEPTDVPIEPGLTGVVGPNGCGKSNLVEALRWVMGESSYKAMRASGMDDVIFSGSGARPARNAAEVTLRIEEAEGKFAGSGSPALADAETLEVARRIEREAGSTYRVNGREVRARDVQLLFADGSTGAHSPAMVGQGRVGELIAAKPTARRALLEEAAGVAGLHGRRDEAEMRLRAAEENLGRLDDVVAELDIQLESLKRQGRQAARYRTLSADVRRTEAAALSLRYTAAAAAAAEAEAALVAAGAAVAAAGEAQGKAVRDQAVAAAAMPSLRHAAAETAAALQRLRSEAEALETEDRRVRDRLADLSRRIADFRADLQREQGLAGENAAALARLEAEEQWLAGEGAGAGKAREDAEIALAAAENALAATEQAAVEATARLAALVARRQQLQRAFADAAARTSRHAEERRRIASDLSAHAVADRDGPVAAARSTAIASETAATRADDAVLAAERFAALARTRETAARGPAAAAETALTGVDAEARALASFLTRQTRPGGALIDQVRAAPGYEAAVAAAFGDELDLSDDAAQPAHWRALPGYDARAPLPDGTRPLGPFVEAPPALSRRVAATGLALRPEAARLQTLLLPGQVLVSVEGDLWRWDGYTASAEARTPAAERLAARNRLADLSAERERISRTAEAARRELANAAAEASGAAHAETTARTAQREARRNLDAARARLADAERSAASAASRAAALQEAETRVAASHAEAEASRVDAEDALTALPPAAALEADLAARRTASAAARNAVADARTRCQTLEREAAARHGRLDAIAAERAAWRQRSAEAATHAEGLATRTVAAEREQATLAETPADILRRRAALTNAIAGAETARRSAADRLAEAEVAQKTSDRAAEATAAGLSEARETRGRLEERLAAATARRTEFADRILEILGCGPEEALAHAELQAGAPLPALEAVEARLERLRQERERIGPINLRAEQETDEVAARRDRMVADRDDLVEAIGRLRQGIASLNREGRERLTTAFAEVNQRFQALFTHLFSGGTAELTFTESDDPLLAGLDILARPPGKKPQTLTLLSGGEQALTALALIFAVFLTNPAPICVLDEVDAPLDDANVERFCNLLDEMTRQTDTRFLVITHNPITMARMNRLFGVTMAERGVSQLVSVDLQAAERFREAG